jgi:acetolactate synthase-1/2/3 large subunit
MQTLTDIQTGAKTLIQTLKSLGCDTIFGYPGGIVLNVYDELAKQNDVKHYLVRHEQSAVHSAEGYARVSGKCGVALVTSGPGATNIITGLANAYLDGFPLVVITGQVSAELLHQDAFQEVDIIDITKSCTKKNFQVKSIDTLQDTLKEAFEVAMSGKKGPVVVDITKNVFSEKAEYRQITLKQPENLPVPDVSEAINAISNSKRPVIITGGGTIDASNEVIQFAKSLNIPVVSTMMGLGVYPASDKNYLGMIGIFGNANKVVRESDLIIAIGTRFNDRIKNCLGEISNKLIHIDINKVIQSSIGLVGDAKEILAEINSKNVKVNDFTSWIEFAKSLTVQNYQKRSDRMHSFEVLEQIQECLKDVNPIIATEVGQHQVWASRCLGFDEPRKFITSGGLGTMGFGFPASIGASIASGNSPVVCIAGDGSFQMSLQEIATCMDYNLPIKVFILNNGYLGMVRQFQEKICEQRYFATKISNPDFVKLAQSYGALGIRVENSGGIKPAVKQAMEYNGTVVVDFVIEPEELL